MDTLHDLLVKRHSIRRYTEQPISPDDVTTIMQAALLAPSSKSKRPWQFVIVEDRDKLATLATCKAVAAHAIRGARFAVAVCADPTSSDMYLEDCAIAAEFMQLQAAALGIGSCWVQVRGRFTADGTPSEEMVREELGSPENFTVECIMSFGYSAENRKPVDLEKLKWEQVHIEKWTNREQ